MSKIIYPVRKYPAACHRVIPNLTNTGFNTPCEFSNGIYCADKTSQVKLSLTYSFKRTLEIENVYGKDYPLVIFDGKVLLKKKVNVSKLSKKMCIICFQKENKDNINLVRRYGFFDYFTV